MRCSAAAALPAAAVGVLARWSSDGDRELEADSATRPPLPPPLVVAVTDQDVAGHRRQSPGHALFSLGVYKGADPTRPQLPPPVVAAVTDQDVRGAGLDGEALEQHAHVREVATLAGVEFRAGRAAAPTIIETH